MSAGAWLLAIGSIGASGLLGLAWGLDRLRPVRSLLALASGLAAPVALFALVLQPFIVSELISPSARPPGAPPPALWYSPRALLFILGPHAWLLTLLGLFLSRERGEGRGRAQDMPWGIAALAAVPFVLLAMGGMLSTMAD